MIGVALVLLIVVAGIVIAGKKNKDDGTASGRTTTTSASGTTSSGGAGRKAGCPSWPALYRVQPSALTKDGAAPGVYVWNDPFTGWHVRVVGGEGMQLLNGTMVSSGKRVDAKANPDGAAKLTPKGNTLSFEVGPASKPVGFDAVVGCQADQISFTFNNNGTALPANMVFVGDGNSAVSNPLVVQRASS
ncbi:MAG: hypothetical protein HYX34_01545 [Actinobacteria bacterium]|nr:hypothetical protein [Actinomycetota bacterium]